MACWSQVIGVAFDGTGYGTDGQIPGGEFRRAIWANSNALDISDYIPLAGGDKRRATAVAQRACVPGCRLRAWRGFAAAASVPEGASPAGFFCEPDDYPPYSSDPNFVLWTFVRRDRLRSSISGTRLVTRDKQRLNSKRPQLTIQELFCSIRPRAPNRFESICETRSDRSPEDFLGGTPVAVISARFHVLRWRKSSSIAPRASASQRV